MPDSGHGRGVDCLHPAVRATSEPLRDEQMPIDRHLAPRDATERRPIRQGVLQSRGTCLPACSEARRGKPERELEGSEAVTKLRHGHHPRTWPDHREVKETGPRRARVLDAARFLPTSRTPAFCLAQDGVGEYPGPRRRRVPGPAVLRQLVRAAPDIGGDRAGMAGEPEPGAVAGARGKTASPRGSAYGGAYDE